MEDADSFVAKACNKEGVCRLKREDFCIEYVDAKL